MTEFLTKILEKYNLQENLEWQIDGKTEILVDKLKSLTSENYYSVIFAVFDFTASKDKNFIGTISTNRFVIRKRIKSFEFLPILAKVKGEFTTVDGKTKLIAKVTGMRPILLVLRLLIFTFLTLLALLLILEALISLGEVNPIPGIFILIGLFVIFILIPLIMGQRNVKKMKTELNRILE